MWYYSIDGKQQGPLDDGALDKLIADGNVTPSTLVWKEGMPNWTSLDQARPRGISGNATVEDAASSTCTLCGKRVGADNLIDLMGNRVCADCKPIAVQSLKEGAALPAKNHTAWRDGKMVVARNQTSLPARCFRCNQGVAKPPLTRKLHWHPVWYYLILLFNLLVYVLVAVFVRKTAVINIYVCERHIWQRRYFMVGGWSGSIFGIFIAGLGISQDISWLILFGFGVFFVALIAGIWGAQLARPARIKGDTVWMTGSGKEFLASLPPLP